MKVPGVADCAVCGQGREDRLHLRTARLGPGGWERMVSPQTRRPAVDSALGDLGRTFSVEEALSGGLVSETTEPANILARAKEIAHELTSETSAVSVALIRLDRSSENDGLRP